MPKAKKGEVWIADLGIAAKTRPCLLLTDEPLDDELALLTVVHHTTSLRGNYWELKIQKPFLQDGAFHLQQINTVSRARLVRRIGALSDSEWELFQDKLAERLCL